MLLLHFIKSMSTKSIFINILIFAHDSLINTLPHGQLELKENLEFLTGIYNTLIS